MNLVDDRTLEALVDGELGDSERAGVLRQLDLKTEDWRRLALAFLADQTLRQTFASQPGTTLLERGSRIPLVHDVVPCPPDTAKAVRSYRRSVLGRWSRALAASAACALLAFGLGTWTGRATMPSVDLSPSSTSPGNVSVAKVGIEPSAPSPASARPEQVAAALPNLSASTRKELERRGFVVSERPRVVSVRQDGRTIQVLVNEIELRYVGHHSAL